MDRGKTLKILHAGALRKPMKELVLLFKSKHPDIETTLEYGGSRTCAKALLEGRDADVIALADPHVFEDLLVPQLVDIFLIFATDRMVLAYDDLSRESGILNEENWIDILLKEDVSFARSDENLDPCGYRALMVWQLAETFYGRPGLYDALSRKCPADRIYPKSIDLTWALLEGRVDYSFSYSSVASQFGFHYIEFPDSINLSSPAHTLNYSRAAVTLAGFGGKFPLVRGAPIEFAVAVSKRSGNREAALSFINLLTSREGEGIIESCGLIPC